jgi:hypothetical protein
MKPSYSAVYLKNIMNTNILEEDKENETKILYSEFSLPLIVRFLIACF